jgi:hypothetical protein
MKTVISIVILLFCSIFVFVPPCEADESNNVAVDIEIKKDLWWVALGGLAGVAYGYPAKKISDTYYHFIGFPIYWNFSYNFYKLPWLLLTVRGFLTYTIFTFEEYDKGALVGIVGKTQHLNMSLGAGIGGVWAEDKDSDWKWIVGAPVEAQFFVVFSHEFGLGLVALADINPIRSYWACTLCMVIGRLRN